MKSKRLTISIFWFIFFLVLQSCENEKNKVADKVQGKVEVYRSYWYSDDYKDSSIQTKCDLVDGRMNGDYRRYYKNGQIKVIAKYKDDKLDEIINVYDTSGQKLDFGQLKNGNGCVTAFDEDGNLMRKGCYRNGVKEGTWHRYDPNGEITNTTKFVKGKEKGYENFDFNLYD